MDYSRVVLKVAAFIFSSVLFFSCANVQQIDRGRLAKTIMQFDPLPHQKRFIDDVHIVREGAAGGTGQSAGGGCGCN